VPFNRKRFGGRLPHAQIEPRSASRVLRKSAGDKKK
jgi:hypothetical protein